MTIQIVGIPVLGNLNARAGNDIMGVVKPCSVYTTNFASTTHSIHINLSANTLGPIQDDTDPQ